jgi:hypothetical protein
MKTEKLYFCLHIFADSFALRVSFRGRPGSELNAHLING